MKIINWLVNKILKISADYNLGEKHDDIGLSTIDESLVIISQYYNKNAKYQNNCQRAVPALEMRLRGYDVMVKPCKRKTVKWDIGRYNYWDMEEIAREPLRVWEDAFPEQAKGNGYEFITEKMQKMPNESRVQILVNLEDGAHTFMAIKLNDKILFIDPQTGEKDASHLFNNAEYGKQNIVVSIILNQTKILSCVAEKDIYFKVETGFSCFFLFLSY